MSSNHIRHRVEREICRRHITRIHCGTEAFLVVAPIDPAVGKSELVCRRMIVEHAFSRMQDLVLLDAEPRKALDHVFEVAR